jgi:hypothetical protein
MAKVGKRHKASVKRRYAAVITVPEPIRAPKCAENEKRGRGFRAGP